MEDAGSPMVCTYGAKTLTGNWSEGRGQSTDYRGKGSTRDRVMPFDLPHATQLGLYKTSNQAQQDKVAAAPRQQPPYKPSMTADPGAAHHTIAAHADATARTAPWQLEQPGKAADDAPDRWQTTYARTTGAAAAAGPAPDKTYARRDMFKQDTQPTITGKTSGRGGARGEFTRWPAEAGSRYGVSVFVDEFAKL